MAHPTNVDTSNDEPIPNNQRQISRDVVKPQTVLPVPTLSRESLFLNSRHFFFLLQRSFVA